MGTKNEEKEDGDVDMTDGPGVGDHPLGLVERIRERVERKEVKRVRKAKA